MELNKIQDIIKEELKGGQKNYNRVTFEIYGKEINFTAKPTIDGNFGFCFFPESDADEKKIEMFLDKTPDESGETRIPRSFKNDNIWKIIADELERRTNFLFVPYWDYEPETKHNNYYFVFTLNWASVLHKIMK